MTHVIHSRPPRGDRRLPAASSDPDILAAHLEDAAHVPGGHADALYTPSTEAEVAEILRAARRVLPIGAQSSLTGGATPQGGALLSTRRFDRLTIEQVGRVSVGAGVPLSRLDQTLAAAGALYPPLPTFMDAAAGGAVSTNAAGAATFKYGSTRAWVDGLTVVLAGGDVLDLQRGVVRAHRDGFFDLVLTDRTARVHVPRYRMPAVPKLSAGYFAAPEMDLIDLFIGSEGTLGVITDITFRTRPRRPARCLAFVTVDDSTRAIALVRDLRERAVAAWRSDDPAGIDVAGVEHMDARCLELLREDGIDRKCDLMLPADAAMALLVALDLPPGMDAAAAYDDIARAASASPSTAALTTFVQLLDAYGLADRTVLALPGETRRAQQFLDLREGVPLAVNRRVGLARQQVDPRIDKTAADAIVPFDRLGEFIAMCRSTFETAGLDGAVWGHISDGNLHPNVLPRRFADVEAGREAMLHIGREAIRLGGAPLAEHGVGRNPTKQRLLRELYGDEGIEAMRRVKAALDPHFKLAPGVIFEF